MVTRIGVGTYLTLEDVIRVSRNYEEVKLSNDALNAMERSRKVLEELIHGNVRIYGVNTGLGDLYSVTVNPEDVAKYSLEMLIDHSTGVGDYAPDDWVRATMLIRAHQLSLGGYSGIRSIVVERLVDFLNMRITPLIPKYGSVGASGDLAPLAHMALTLLGKGFVKYQAGCCRALKPLNWLGLMS
ncbi:aromatic amino acid lyase [Vulcanisaeta distributa]|uniref:aromatic amino acid lyase n=1 Tax=Vulcanisaeta distributa TaxID=164451 RepID=UPI000AEBB40E|nr:aromatic amino acid lyase [Vulcanisaeta distributa]